MSKPLLGKTALVTGGGRGIGRAICLRLARDGSNVAVLSLTQAHAEEVAREAATFGVQTMALQANVSDRQAVRAAVAEVVSSWGYLDTLINNAGIGIFNPLTEITEEELDAQFDVNVKGSFFAMQAAVEHMIERGGGGKIVNISSQSGRRGDANCLSYCMSKAAVISITQSAALALARHKIHVNAVAPGVVDTDFWDAVDKRFADLFGMPVGEPKRRTVAAIPLGRIEQPEDVAGVVSFLVGPDADYMTGQTINVDGGNVLN